MPNLIENFYTADSDLYEPTDVQKIKTKMITSFTGNVFFTCSLCESRRFYVKSIFRRILMVFFSSEF